MRHYKQQVEAASPFECLCAQGGGVDLAANLSAVVAHFARAVPPGTTVFVAGYRVDLVGLDAFHEVWDSVYALALFDWNGAGLQGHQFSSVINRLICSSAEKIHFLPGAPPRLECW